MRYPFFLWMFCTVVYSMTLCGSWWESYDLEKTAIVTAPVADLFVQSAQYYTSFKPATALYKHQALSCEPTVSLACMRAHQVIFNEMLVDANSDGKEVVGRIPNAVYDAVNRGIAVQVPVATFYSDARSVVFLSELVQRGVPLDYIPAPVWQHDNEQKTITLMLPWTDELASIHFSAGTRFVRILQNDTFTHYAVVYVDYKNMKPIMSFVPKALCVPSWKNKRLLFVHILRSLLAKARLGVIPYVWGGRSFVTPFPDKPYSLVSRTVLDKNVTYYQRMPAFQRPMGFDCSGLVWRIAQMVGLPYNFSNTGMIDRQGQPLQPHEHVQLGDLIWLRGHVMIADDPVHNTLAEAAGYGAGFGKVHSIDLAKRMYGISTYADLEDAYRKQNCLMLLKADGSNATSCKPFKIVKLIDA